jgi:uncharacterized membrane protein
MTGWTLLVAAHAFAAALAVPLGGYQLLRRRRGDARHRRVGYVWVVSMLYVSITSFWIRDLRHGQLSLLHILSVVTLVSVILGIVAARRHDVRRHRANLRGAWFGLVGAMIGALAVPDRLLPRFVLGEPVQALGALATTALVFAAVIGLARLREPGRRRRSGTVQPS